MGEDDGLPLPPPPTHRPPPIPRADGVKSGSVAAAIEKIVADDRGRTAKWEGEIAWLRHAPGAAELAGPGDGPSVMGPVRDLTKFQDPDTIFATLEDLAKMATNPIRTIVEEYQAWKVEGLQEEFRREHSGHLQHMSRDVTEAGKAMQVLAQVMERAGALGDNLDKAQQLLFKKAKAGDEEMAELEACIARSKTPENRQALEGLRRDLDAWMKDRDQRVKAELKELDELQKRIGALSRLAFYAANLGRVAQEATLGRRDDTRFATALYVAALRKYLLALHGQLDRGLAGQAIGD